MVRHTDEADDESPAENPPAFADLIDKVDDLSEGDHIRVTYAHKSRHTLDDPDKTTTLDGYVTVADATYQTKHGKNRDRFRLEFRTNHPDSEYAGTLYRIKTGGVNKTRSNPCYVSKSTGPSVRHFQQLGRVDAIDVVEDGDEDDDTEVATDGGTVTTTRRTRADLRYLADVVEHTKVDVDKATDAERNSRLRSHGWVTSNATATSNGHRIAGVVQTLRNDDVEYDDFDMAVDAMGMAEFVDACTEAPSIQDAVAFVRGVFVCANTVDEARHDAGTQDDEFDHDGMFAPHLADFDARRGEVEVRFERESTARSWVGYVSRYDPEFKHDERFKSNRNPRRVVVDVVDY